MTTFSLVAAHVEPPTSIAVRVAGGTAWQREPDTARRQMGTISARPPLTNDGGGGGAAFAIDATRMGNILR